MPPVLTDTMQPPATPLRPGKPLRQRLREAGPIVGLVLLCIAGTLLNPDFATWDNAMNVLTRTAFIGIIAVGMCFVIIS
jgi:ribose transport system permease protein